MLRMSGQKFSQILGKTFGADFGEAATRLIQKPVSVADHVAPVFRALDSHGHTVRGVASHAHEPAVAHGHGHLEGAKMPPPLKKGDLVPGTPFIMGDYGPYCPRRRALQTHAEHLYRQGYLPYQMGSHSKFMFFLAFGAFIYCVSQAFWRMYLICSPTALKRHYPHLKKIN